MTADLLTPWQRFTARWLGWEYARVWVKGHPQTDYRSYYLTVRVRRGELPIACTYYHDHGGVDVSTNRAAWLSEFPHKLLT